YDTDQIGVPHQVIDESGAILWSARYSALGEAEAVTTADESNPFRFQGQYHDPETGLCYNRFRYFDPAISQFISQDPIRLAGGPNIYAYCPNGWGWLDPLGLSCKPREISLGKDLPNKG